LAQTEVGNRLRTGVDTGFEYWSREGGANLPSIIVSFRFDNSQYILGLTKREALFCCIWRAFQNPLFTSLSVANVVQPAANLDKAASRKLGRVVPAVVGLMEGGTEASPMVWAGSLKPSAVAATARAPTP